MNRNYSIKCDVEKCKHNAEGCNCQLECIKVTCGCGDTCKIWKNRFKKPLLQGEITTNAPEEDHRTMVVTVDETGHKHSAAHIFYDIKLTVGKVHTDIRNGISVNTKEAVFQHKGFAVFPCDNIAIFK